MVDYIICVFEGGGHGAEERKVVAKRCFFLERRNDNTFLNVQQMIVRNVVVIAQAPRYA